MTEPIAGTCTDQFTGVRDALATVLEESQGGASAAVFWRGQLVADVWGGYEDRAQTRPWQRDTLVNVWSITKTMTNLCALILADRGQIDVESPVREYWPEFGAAGKDGVLVRHLLGHTAGLPGWSEPPTTEDLYDWKRTTALLAEQAPWWVPGSVSGYHMVTQGYLVGEVVRRVTGKTVGEYFAETVAGPLGADFHIGLGAENDQRVAQIFNPTGLKVPEEQKELLAKLVGRPNVLDDPTEITATREWRAAEIPACNGQGNARSVALVHALIAGEGTLNGTTILSPTGVARLFDQQSDGVDLVLREPLKFGLGWALAKQHPAGGDRTCYWGGAGGHKTIADLDNNLSIAFVMNHMQFGSDGINTGGDRRAELIVNAAYEALGR